tara:strand:+ start:97280 stop:97468 length:189 start_codon:yes stop_codon:yes gene_type:complete
VIFYLKAALGRNTTLTLTHEEGAKQSKNNYFQRGGSINKYQQRFSISRGILYIQTKNNASLF